MVIFCSYSPGNKEISFGEAFSFTREKILFNIYLVLTRHFHFLSTYILCSTIKHFYYRKNEDYNYGMLWY